MLTDWMLRLRALFKRTTVEREIDDELRFHFDHQVDSYVKRGLEREEAVRRARLEFGGLDQIKEEYRDALGVRLIDRFSRDLRLAVRSLRSTPIVTTVAILSLALGIGANTAIFSLIDSLVLRTLPCVVQPEQLVTMCSGSPCPTEPRWSYAFWKEIEKRSQAFDGAFAWSARRFDLSASGEIQSVEGVLATGSFFETLGVRTAIGRTFTDADDVLGGTNDGPVAVIGYNLWQRRFGASPQVVGMPLMINRVPFTIIGVAPAGFFGTEVGRSMDIAVPLSAEPLLQGSASNLKAPFDKFNLWLVVALRLKPEQSLEAATTILRDVQPHIREAAKPHIPQVREFEFIKEPFTLSPISTGISGLRRSYQRPLVMILLVVALVLLVACANIANLQLARARMRRHELSVRQALGATRWQLTRQLLIESLLLAAVGAGFALAIASWGSRVLVAQISTQASSITLHLPLDWRVLGFTMAITIATVLLFGVAPAFQAARVAPIEAIKVQWRGLVGEHRTRFAATLVVLQVGISLVLVVFAGLFISSLQRLTSRSLGFDTQRALHLRVDAAQASIKPSDRATFYQRLVDAAAAVPGVESAAASDKTPFDRGNASGFVRVSGAPREVASESISARISYITPAWFATYGIPLRAGRGFDVHDRNGGMPVLIVNEAFVRKFFPAGNALGSAVILALGQREEYTMGPRTVVGVVGDTIYSSLREASQAIVYLPLAQYDLPVPPFAFINVTVRAAAGSPAALAAGVKGALASVDRNLTVRSSTLDIHVNDSLRQERLLALLTGSFAALGLLLAGLGLYGVTAYAVARRRTEIGIRMALGAVQTTVVRLVVSRVAKLVGIGIVAGTVASLWLSRFVASLLYGLEPGDPTTLLVAVVVLGAVGIAAALLPAMRASRIDPAAVLRES
jgi:putative ABC transport system permease protein